MLDKHLYWSNPNISYLKKNESKRKVNLGRINWGSRLRFSASRLTACFADDFSRLYIIIHGRSAYSEFQPHY
jgi:hypothetical protein